MSGKKGLSPIIGSVLIIMLSIAGIALIAGFVVPFIRDSLSGATECLPYQKYFSFDDTFDYNCFNGNEIKFSVKANPLKKAEDIELKEFRIVFLGEAESSSASIKEGSAPGEIVLLGNGTANLKVPKIGEVRTYIYVGTTFKSMELYPVLESGRICEVSDSVKLRIC